MSKILNKFTKLKRAKEILLKQKFVLSSPFVWEDLNDVNCIQKYNTYKKAKSILASCLVDGRERYHHWKVYASGREGDDMGVCIEFNKENLIKCFEAENKKLVNKQKSIRYSNVSYRWIREFKEEVEQLNNSLISKLPFRKRRTFGDEKEYRILYEDMVEKTELYFVPITKIAINRVTLSPYATIDDKKDLIKFINSLKGYEHLKVNISGMLAHPTWQKILNKY